jgi:hypothetical protein
MVPRLIEAEKASEILDFERANDQWVYDLTGGSPE